VVNPRNNHWLANQTDARLTDTAEEWGERRRHRQPTHHAYRTAKVRCGAAAAAASRSPAGAAVAHPTGWAGVVKAAAGDVGSHTPHSGQSVILVCCNGASVPPATAPLAPLNLLAVAETLHRQAMACLWSVSATLRIGWRHPMRSVESARPTGKFSWVASRRSASLCGTFRDAVVSTSRKGEESVGRDASDPCSYLW